MERVQVLYGPERSGLDHDPACSCRCRRYLLRLVLTIYGPALYDGGGLDSLTAVAVLLAFHALEKATLSTHKQKVTGLAFAHLLQVLVTCGQELVPETEA
ncbi:hypothetical protein Droror1_Dr00010024 [Drosera rotundifolia]